MKIAFCGAHGVGKSTLLQHEFWKNSSFINYKVIESYSRNHSKGWIDKRRQFQVNTRYILSHIYNTNFISARSIFDPWAYSRLNINLDFNFQLFNLAVKFINYDFLFYIPIEFDIYDDGVRPQDKDFQRAIDIEISNLLRFYHIPYHIITGGVDCRIGMIRDIMSV